MAVKRGVPVFCVYKNGFACLIRERSSVAASRIRRPEYRNNMVAADRGARFLTALGRLKPGVTVEQANARLKLVAERQAAEFRLRYPSRRRSRSQLGPRGRRRGAPTAAVQSVIARCVTRKFWWIRSERRQLLRRSTATRMGVVDTQDPG